MHWMLLQYQIPSSMHWTSAGAELGLLAYACMLHVWHGHVVMCHMPVLRLGHLKYGARLQSLQSLVQSYTCCKSLSSRLTLCMWSRCSGGVRVFRIPSLTWNTD